MKKKLFALALVTLSIISCNSDNDVDISTSNLKDISSKLEKLQVKDIQTTTTDDIELDENSSNFKKTIPNKTLFTDCNHEEIYSDDYDNILYESTSYYFDQEGNKITNCDAYMLENYTIVEELKTVGSDFEYQLSATTNYAEINKETNDYFYHKSSQNTDFTGILNFDGDIFNIVSGSSSNLLVEYTISFEDIFNEFSDNEDPEITIDILYIMEFEVNNQTYHFNMTLTEEEILSIDDVEESENNGFELNYDLFNSDNEKIGTIKYLQNFNTEKEWFEVYDLDGNKV